jgi:hypothetical protein
MFVSLWKLNLRTRITSSAHACSEVCAAAGRKLRHSGRQAAGRTGEVSCAVCHSHYDRPKLLPCNHYYCAACIENLATHARGKPFECPECRRSTSLPAGGVAELDGAFFVERMKDLYGKMARVEGKVEAACEQCGEGTTVAFCRQSFARIARFAIRG